MSGAETLEVVVKPAVSNELVRHLLVDSYRAVESSIHIVREKHSGEHAACAVSFEERNGGQRRGLIGLCRHHDGTWQPSGGVMGSPRVTDAEGVFTTCGGWGSVGRKERAAFGGWPAEPSAASARMVDVRSGQVFAADEVENGVVIFLSEGDFPLRYARVELLDSAQRVLRAGPAMHAAV